MELVARRGAPSLPAKPGGRARPRVGRAWKRRGLLRGGGLKEAAQVLVPHQVSLRSRLNPPFPPI